MNSSLCRSKYLINKLDYQPLLVNFTQVLLVLVSNLTGNHTEYTQEHLWMIIADVMAVTFFVFCILTSQIWVKIICYLIAALGFIFLYWIAYKCFIAAGKEVPTKGMQRTILALHIIYHIGWNIHTVQASIGPDCLGALGFIATQIFACFGDLVAKVGFCAVVTFLRLQLHFHAKKLAKIAENGGEGT